MINLKLVDESSFQAVLDLKISEADERARFVAPNVRSLADAWLYRENEDVFPRAIYWDKQVVGFLLLEIDKDEAEYFIWRIMIGQQYQGRGYGRKALEVLIKKAQMDRACNHIIADYVVGNEKMKHLLTSLGFQETGFIEENNAGVVVGSLLEIENVLNNISEEEYAQIKQNAEKIGAKLREGYYYKKALEKCLAEDKVKE